MSKVKPIKSLEQSSPALQIIQLKNEDDYIPKEVCLNSLENIKIKNNDIRILVELNTNLSTKSVEKNNTISTLEEKNKNLENKLQEALKPKFNKNSALEASAALEAVTNEVVLDYDKLYAALKKLNVL